MRSSSDNQSMLIDENQAVSTTITHEEASAQKTDTDESSGQPKDPAEVPERHITTPMLRMTCVIAIIAWFIVAILLSLITESDPFFTFLGLSPIIFTIVVTYMLVDKYHMETGFLMIFPFIFTGMFLVLGVARLLGGIDYLTLSTVNIVCGLFFEAVLVMQHSFVHKTHHARKKKQDEQPKPAPVEKKEEPVDLNLEIQSIVQPRKEEPAKVEVVHVVEEKKELPVVRVILDSEEDVKKFVASIEDKAKAINAVIGRVYSVNHGGSDPLRKKIKIDPEHYNDFSLLLKEHEAIGRKRLAVSLLRKIKASIEKLGKRERDVFDRKEMKKLTGLKRHSPGGTKVIDVLSKNDSDPVKTYYEGALEFCSNALSELQK